jgi:soluble lytic murein transglycosylase-like protein
MAARRRPARGGSGRRVLLGVTALVAVFLVVSFVRDLVAPSRSRSVRAAVGYWAAVYRVNPHLARAVAWNESGFNPDEVSATGAQGAMQVQPATWRFVERRILHRRVAHSPEGGVQVGVAYLHYLLVCFHDDRTLALAAYYQGPEAVLRYGLYRSTRQYVATVLALSERF